MSVLRLLKLRHAIRILRHDLARLAERSSGDPEPVARAVYPIAREWSFLAGIGNTDPGASAYDHREFSESEAIKAQTIDEFVAAIGDNELRHAAESDRSLLEDGSGIDEMARSRLYPQGIPPIEHSMFAALKHVMLNAAPTAQPCIDWYEDRLTGIVHETDRERALIADIGVLAGDEAGREQPAVEGGPIGHKPGSEERKFYVGAGPAQTVRPSSMEQLVELASLIADVDSSGRLVLKLNGKIDAVAKSYDIKWFRNLQGSNIARLRKGTPGNAPPYFMAALKAYEEEIRRLPEPIYGYLEIIFSSLEGALASAPDEMHWLPEDLQGAARNLVSLHKEALEATKTTLDRNQEIGKLSVDEDLISDARLASIAGQAGERLRDASDAGYVYEESLERFSGLQRSAEVNLQTGAARQPRKQPTLDVPAEREGPPPTSKRDLIVQISGTLVAIVAVLEPSLSLIESETLRALLTFAKAALEELLAAILME